MLIEKIAPPGQLVASSFPSVGTLATPGLVLCNTIDFLKLGNTRSERCIYDF